MKASLFILLIIIGGFQNSVPPQKIANAFNKKFPSATIVKWEKPEYSRSELWKASFILGGKRATCTYFSDGRWLETTLEIPGKELNETVKASVMDDHPKCEILSAIITEYDITTWYLVKIRCKDRIFDVSYDYQGMPYPPRI